MPKPKTSEVRGFNGVEPQQWPVFGLKTQKRLKKTREKRSNLRSGACNLRSGGILTSEVVAR